MVRLGVLRTSRRWISSTNVCCYVVVCLQALYRLDILDMIHSDGISQFPSQVQPRNALSAQSPSNHWGTLCPELIYEIFICCIPAATLDACAPGSFPWYLGHICSLWRSVFISSPRFWDRFAFKVYIKSRKTYAIGFLKRALTLVELCVKRTKDQPFSFRFIAQVRVNTDDLELIPSLILETIVAHADRWRAAYIKAFGLYNLEELLLKAKHRYGQLHTLELLISWNSVTSCLDHFEGATNLTRVCITDYHRLRWSSITFLRIEHSWRTTTCSRSSVR